MPTVCVEAKAVIVSLICTVEHTLKATKTVNLQWTDVFMLWLTCQKMSLALFVVSPTLARKAVPLVIIARGTILGINISRAVRRQAGTVVLNVTLPC